MPVLSIERLTGDSQDAQVAAALSDCIATEVRGGMPQDQAIAACQSMVREKSGGRPIDKGVS